jgi:hypothetical protein
LSSGINNQVDLRDAQRIGHAKRSPAELSLG